MWDEWVAVLMNWLELPQNGLSSVFLISFLSATLLPIGSEAAVFGLLKLNPSIFWETMVVATIGNTLGGCVSWWMGKVAHQAVDHRRGVKNKQNPKALRWLERFGAKACFLSFLPVVGDPLCAAAGYLRLSFWSCTFYMAFGKFLRYLVLTWALINAVDYGFQ